MINYNNFTNEGFYYKGGGNIRPAIGDIIIVKDTYQYKVFHGKVGKIIQMYTLDVLVEFRYRFSTFQNEDGTCKWIPISDIENVDPEKIKKEIEFRKAMKINDPYNEEIWEMKLINENYIKLEVGDIIIVDDSFYPEIYRGKIGKIAYIEEKKYPPLYIPDVIVDFKFGMVMSEPILNWIPKGHNGLKWIPKNYIEQFDPMKIKKDKEFKEYLKINDPYNEEIWDMNEGFYKNYGKIIDFKKSKHSKGDIAYHLSKFSMMSDYIGKVKIIDILEDHIGEMWYEVENKKGKIRWIPESDLFPTLDEYENEIIKREKEKENDIIRREKEKKRKDKELKKWIEKRKIFDPYDEEDWTHESKINERKIAYKKELCSDLWNKDMELNEKISTKLLKLAKDFYKDIELDTEILDIHLTGSMVNYNYTAESDIDVHIEIDFADINDDVVLVKKAVDGQRFIWNMRHYITIRGHNVELYIIDKREEHISGGLYSLLNGEWIKKPKYAPPDVDTEDIDVKYDARATDIIKFEEVSRSDISATEAEEYYENARDLKSKIMKARKAGLTEDGEFSIENLVFKKLRKTGKFKKLLDTIGRLYDKIFSQE